MKSNNQNTSEWKVKLESYKPIRGKRNIKENKCKDVVYEIN